MALAEIPGEMVGMIGQTFTALFTLPEKLVEIGGVAFEVLHCPGHTPGHVVFVSAALRFALVGDVLFQGSVGRTDLPQGDHQQLIRSIVGKLWPLGNDTAFIPGHGQPSTFGHERQHNMFVSDRALAA